MSYRLVLTKNDQDGGRILGENVFIENLPSASDIFIFFYPSESFSMESLETWLRNYDKKIGVKIFVNMGRIGDRNYQRIVRHFEIKTLPVIIITGKDDIASIKDGNDSKTVYVKFEGGSLKNLERTISFVEKAVNLLIDDKIKEAQQQTREFLFSTIKDSILRTFQNIQEISVGLLDGTFKVIFKG